MSAIPSFRLEYPDLSGLMLQPTVDPGRWKDASVDLIYRTSVLFCS